MYYKTIGETELMYDEDNHMLFRFNKIKNDWTEFDINYTPTKTYRYKRICIDTKTFKLHRLIYYICNDDFDIFDSTVTIDHGDLDTGNNKLSNLSKRTFTEQSQHRTCKGISIQLTPRKTKESYLRFVVSWSENKKEHTKSIQNYWIARWVRAIKIQKAGYYRGTN